MKIVSLVLFALLISLSFVRSEEIDRFPLNKGTIYDYRGKGLPDICFFPVKKAKWNGYKITDLNWKQLTDGQKVMFLKEGTQEILRNEDVSIEIDDRLETWLGYVTLINQSLDMGDVEEAGGSGFNMLRFYRELLKMRGAVIGKDGDVLKSELKQEALQDEEI